MSSHDSRTEDVVEVKVRWSRAEMGSLKLKAPSWVVNRRILFEDVVPFV